MSLEERFWAKVNIQDELSCWEWTGAKDSSGYGCIRDDASKGGRRLIASRLSLVWHTKFDNKEFVAMHICDNPGCVNPKHLRWATQEENMQDMVNKGRGDNQHGYRSPKRYGVLDG